MPPACRPASIFLPLNTAYTAAELDYFVGNSGARLVLCDRPRPQAALTPVAQAARRGADDAERRWDRAASPQAARGQPDAFDTVDRERRRSGGVPLHLRHHRALEGRDADPGQPAVERRRRWPITGGSPSDDVLLHALPIFHTHGLFVATNVTLMAGGSMIFLPKFDLDAMIALTAAGDRR